MSIIKDGMLHHGAPGTRTVMWLHVNEIALLLLDLFK